MKKMICILAAVTLTFSAMPASVYALNTVSDGYETEILPVTEFQYETNEDGVTITGKGNFTGKVNKSFIIVPKKATIAKKKAPGKVYYIRARSFVTVSKKNRFGKYSKVTKIKCR